MPTVTTPGHWLISVPWRQRVGDLQAAHVEDGQPLSVSTPGRSVATPPRRAKRRVICAAAIGITSTGNGKRAQHRHQLASSAMQTKRSARSATIFSRVSAAPPPLIMWPLGSISSAPSM
jgi:hypothetical protein